MSSFVSPHRMYLFTLKNGKKKLAYGESPEDALEILRIRLTAECSTIRVPIQLRSVLPGLRCDG